MPIVVAEAVGMWVTDRLSTCPRPFICNKKRDKQYSTNYFEIL